MATAGAKESANKRSALLIKFEAKNESVRYKFYTFVGTKIIRQYGC